MRQAGRAQRFPIGSLEPARVAERQRAHETRRWPRYRAAMRRDMRSRHASMPRAGCTSLARFRVAHVAGRGDALHQCVPLAVDAAGIAQAARRAQLQRHAPMAARGQLERCVVATVPSASSYQARRSSRPRKRSGLRGIVVDAQQETRAPRLRAAAGRAMRPDNAASLPLERGRQLLRERRRRMQAGESKAECRQRQHALRHAGVRARSHAAKPQANSAASSGQAGNAGSSRQASVPASSATAVAIPKSGVLAASSMTTSSCWLRPRWAPAP